MGVLAEIFSDDKGLMWPESVAPFQIHLLALGESENVQKEANAVYESLVAAGEAAAQVDGGALYDLTHLAAMERNLRAFEAKHLKIGMLPVKDGGA